MNLHAGDPSFMEAAKWQCKCFQITELARPRDQFLNRTQEIFKYWSIPPTLRTANELSRPLKLARFKQLQEQLQLPHRPLSPSFAFRLWFSPGHRRVSIVLHRLRNGHNWLRNHTSRFQIIREDVNGVFRDRFCRFGYFAVENAP